MWSLQTSLNSAFPPEAPVAPGLPLQAATRRPLCTLFRIARQFMALTIASRRLTVIPVVRRSSNGSVKGQLAPSSFYCPISMELMSDPVVLATGHTYERVCIERWLQQGNRTCPVTGMRLRHLELTPNFALRVAVQVSWPKANGRASLPRTASALRADLPAMLRPHPHMAPLKAGL